MQQWVDAKSTPTTRDAARDGGCRDHTDVSAHGQASVGGAAVRGAARVTLTPAAPAVQVKPADRWEKRFTRCTIARRRAGGTAVVPVESLQVRFNPQDEKLLALSDPQFKFNIDGRRARNLGDVSWEVTVITNGGSKKVSVIADAAWQAAGAHRQAPGVQADHPRRRPDRPPRPWWTGSSMNPRPPARRSSARWRAASSRRDRRWTPRLRVDPVPLVQTGQLVTITAAQGSVPIKTVARAMEPGTFGQTVRVRNEATRDIYEVTLTGPQEGRMTGSSRPQPRHAGTSRMERN